MLEASHESKRTCKSPQNVEGEECERIRAELRAMKEKTTRGLINETWLCAICSQLQNRKADFLSVFLKTPAPKCPTVVMKRQLDQ